jgi:hypothetical protein
VSKQAFSVTKKSRGRPKGKTRPETIPVRVSITTLASVDKWIAEQADAPSRPDAITHLIEAGLASSVPAGTKGRKSKKA